MLSLMCNELLNACCTFILSYLDLFDFSFGKKIEPPAFEFCHYCLGMLKCKFCK